MSAAGIATIAQPPTSGPPVCHKLAASVALRQLPSALELQSDARLGDQARSVIGFASTTLHQLAGGAGSLAPRLDSAAAALAPLASGVPASAADSAAASTALNALGQEVQARCDFPVG